MAADAVTENTTALVDDPLAIIAQGKRHLLVHDYHAAVSTFAMGCQLLALKYGDTCDELGEPFLHYGRALLSLSREETGVLGVGVPGTDEPEDDDEEEGEEEAEGANEEESEAKAEEKTATTSEKKEVEKKDEVVEKKKAEETKAEETKTEETKPEDTKTKETKTDEATEPEKKTENDAPAAVPGTSKVTNGEASTSGTSSRPNGHLNEPVDEDADDLSNEDDEGSNLQIAWEVLELAKLILVKRGKAGWKFLAETHRLLGEVAMESDNQVGALQDLHACLDLYHKIEPVDPRTIAEIHYQLGLAYSLSNDFDNSVAEFEKAVTMLEQRIADLESGNATVPESDEPGYTVENEIAELKELLPEIKTKIADMKDFKMAASKAIIEGIKKTVAAGGCSNGAGPSSSTDGASSSSSSATTAADISKPVSDISHLVRKKRKPEEEEAAEQLASPAKKPTLDN